MVADVPVGGCRYGSAVLPTISDTEVEVRDAGPAELPAVRRVLLAAYWQYAEVLPPAVFGPYLTDILDVEGRARTGRVLVAEHGRKVVGTVTFYADAAAEGFGLPAGWAGLRALGVEPSARGHGVGRAPMEACRRLAEAAGATVLSLHTAEFMTAAVALYERLGYRRDPAFDFDGPAMFGLEDARPVPVITYRLDLGRDGQQPVRVGALYDNLVTGERAVVRVAPGEANGHLLVADLYLRPGGAVAGEHVHPATTEAFTVVRGRLAVRHGGRELLAGPGTRVEVRPGVAHDVWNPTGEEVRVVVEVRPGERFEQLIRQLFLAAQDGRTDARGRPRPLHAAVLAREFDDTIRFTSPPGSSSGPCPACSPRWPGPPGGAASTPATPGRELPVVDLEPLPAEVAALVPGLATQPTRSAR
jgi:GNAT superfamily N-acetyltransferase/mannose-6-phosphate isomerase-like protein (cupin superfamily)